MPSENHKADTHTPPRPFVNLTAADQWQGVSLVIEMLESGCVCLYIGLLSFVCFHVSVCVFI